MENEELVYNFMEISNLPIDEARLLLEQSGYNLELALQIYYEQTTTTTNSNTASTSSQQAPSRSVTNSNSVQATAIGCDEEEEIREPIPRNFDVLVPQEPRFISRLTRVRQQFSSTFRDFRKELQIQEELAANGGSNPAKRKCLEDIYRHPIDIIVNIDCFHQAKYQAQKLGKWIAVLINNESLESLSLNRDIFNEPSQRVKQILKQNFLVLRKNAQDEGLKILQIYGCTDSKIPIILLIDPLTGELKKNFGDCTKLTVANVVRELKRYTATTDKQLVYNDAYEHDDDDNFDGIGLNYSAPSTSNSQIPQSFKPATVTTKKDVESDEESFASLNSNDLSDDDEDDNDIKNKKKVFEKVKVEEEEAEEIGEARVLDSDDELLKSDYDGPQTNILLRMNDGNHKFRYPSNRTVSNLINYIYRNYLVQTGIYDNKTKRFSLISKIHNNKCLTLLDQEKSLEESDIHPSIVLLHNTLDKDD